MTPMAVMLRLLLPERGELVGLLCLVQIREAARCKKGRVLFNRRKMVKVWGRYTGEDCGCFWKSCCCNVIGPRRVGFWVFCWKRLLKMRLSREIGPNIWCESGASIFCMMSSIYSLHFFLCFIIIFLWSPIVLIFSNVHFFLLVLIDTDTNLKLHRIQKISINNGIFTKNQNCHCPPKIQWTCLVRFLSLTFPRTFFNPNMVFRIDFSFQRIDYDQMS